MKTSIISPKLIASKPKVFNSTRVDGVRLIEQKFTPQTGSYPLISVNKILDGTKVNAECTIKEFANGSRLEIYKMKDTVLKFVKNKFGEILSFKYHGAGEKGNIPRENIIENIKLSFASKVRSFLE